MMQYKIFQLENMRDSEYGFMSWSFARDHGFSINDYREVYSGDIDRIKNDPSCALSLEAIFTDFNVNRTNDFRGHSLSVSDIVSLKRFPDRNSRNYYYCDSFGWKDITRSVEDQLKTS